MAAWVLNSNPINKLIASKPERIRHLLLFFAAADADQQLLCSSQFRCAI
jgi:hypothetical protein